MRLERRERFQLKRRDFRHGDVAFRKITAGKHRHADISASRSFYAARRQHFRKHAYGGGFSVGARYGKNAALQIPRGKFRFADHRFSRAFERHGERVVHGNARTEHKSVATVYQFG